MYTMTEKTDAGYSLLAAEYARRQAKQLGSQLGGIRQANDIEFVHRARVASRRLRAGLRMFKECFPAEQLKKWRKQTRRLTTGLGEARDTDVQIVYLESSLHASEDDACRAVLARLLSDWQQRRDRLQPKVVAALDRFCDKQVLKQITVTASEMISAAGKASTKSEYAFSRNEQHIRACLDTMLECRRSLKDPREVTGQHEMRIAAKRLRYSLEIVAPLYDDKLDEHIGAVRKLQTRLGNMRDCDVWMDRLKMFERRERESITEYYGHDGPFDRYKPGVELLLKERRQSRKELFDKVVAYWKELEKKGQWQQLIDVLKRRKQPGGPGS